MSLQQRAAQGTFQRRVYPLDGMIAAQVRAPYDGIPFWRVFYRFVGEEISA
jgi:hypothetical protein